MRKYINIITEASNLPSGSILAAGTELYHGTSSNWDPATQHLRGPAWFGSMETASQYSEDGGVIHQYETTRALKMIDYDDLRDLSGVDDMEDDYALNDACEELGYDGWFTDDQICILDTANVKLVGKDVGDETDGEEFGGSEFDKGLAGEVKALSAKAAAFGISSSITMDRLIIRLPYKFTPSDEADAVVNAYLDIGEKYNIQTGMWVEDYYEPVIPNHYGLVPAKKLDDYILYTRRKTKKKKK